MAQTSWCLLNMTKPGGQGWEMKEEDRQHGVSEMSSQLSEVLKIERFKSELAWIPFY